MDLFESLFTPWREGDSWFLNEEIVLQKEIGTAKGLRAIVDFVSGNVKLHTRVNPWIGLEDWPIIKAMISPWPTSLVDSILASDALIDSKRLSQLLITLNHSERPVFIALKHKIHDHRKETKRPVSATSAPLISLSQVRRLAKLDAAATTALFNSPYFKITEIRNGPKGPTYWVGKADFEELSRWIADTVSLNRAAEILGCAPMSVRGLARIGRLQAVSLPCKPRSLRFFRSTLDTFIKSIEILIADISHKDFCLVPLSSVAPARAGCKRWCSNWPTLIEGILAGTVPVFRIDGKRGWDGIGVRAEDIKACIYTFE